ncbi:MAG: peptidoglycan bridge formation glycyltransferase FemA/FemB family protein [Eubacteriales bacterium]|nr:peptidoglycan bridge formation glycyltransferase FemA/FemB family protein [Eubacteriales bacterium]
MQYKLIEISSEEYQQEFAKCSDPNLLQSAEWASLKSEWEAERYALVRSADSAGSKASVEPTAGEIVAIGQLLYRAFPLGYKLAYLAFGPCLLEAGTEAERLIFYRELKAKLAQKKGCFLLKVHSPKLRKIFPLGSSEPADNPAADQAFLAEMAALGFQHKGFSRDLDSTIQPRYQAVIHRADWPEKPFSKLRYNLRQLARREVRIERGGLERLAEFMHCLACTEARQEISLRNPEYFKRLLELYPSEAELYLAVFDIPKGREKAAHELQQLEAELAKLRPEQVKKQRQLEEQLSSARKISDFFAGLEAAEEVTIGAALAIHLGAVSEMPYAGNDDQYFELPGAWGIYNEVITDAFSRGAERLNLGGVDGQFNDGLSRFKAHFSPRIEENYGEFDLPLKPLVAKGFNTALKLRKKLKG